MVRRVRWVVLVVTATALLAAGGCQRRSTPASELARRRGVYAVIVTGLQKGELVPDASGTVALPKGLIAASVDGQVLVASRSDLLLVVFKTWRGKACNMQGFLFASRPLQQADMRKDYYGNNTVLVGPAPLTVSGQLEPNWYLVTRSED